MPRGGVPALVGAVARIESDSLLFRVMPDYGEYPVCMPSMVPDKRFLLCTDVSRSQRMRNGDLFGYRGLSYARRRA
jgi:hypothetical protein